jgi:GNAT superfamily N-acetyltransferase
VSTIEVHPATTQRWRDIATLLGEDGENNGCWCMYFRRTRSEFHAARGAVNRTALKDLTERATPPGLIAYVEGRAAGWCAVAPREEYGRIGRSPVLKPVDDRTAWAITCLYTSAAYRGRGVADSLVAAAVKFVAHHGAQQVEAYPLAHTGRVRDAEAYTGTPSLYARHGFGHIVTRGGRSIWRRNIEPGVQP